MDRRVTRGDEAADTVSIGNNLWATISAPYLIVLSSMELLWINMRSAPALELISNCNQQDALHLTPSLTTLSR